MKLLDKLIENMKQNKCYNLQEQTGIAVFGMCCGVDKSYCKHEKCKYFKRVK